MKTIEINAEVRKDLGKSNTKKLREAGKVPCVLYGGKENQHLNIVYNDLLHLVYTPNVYLVKLKVDKKEYTCITQDIQFHPVSDKILHIDFLTYSEDKPVKIEIPVKTIGLAEGVKAGGKLNIEQRRLMVSALAKDLPDVLEIDVTKLGLSKSIKVAQLNFENLEILNSKSSVVVAVKLTRAARGMTLEEETEGAEPTEETESASEE